MHAVIIHTIPQIQDPYCSVITYKRYEGFQRFLLKKSWWQEEKRDKYINNSKGNYCKSAGQIFSKERKNNKKVI